MTTAEIFSNISDHMLKGMMMHEEMADYYHFLGLCGYKKFHEHQFCEESKAFRSLHRYYIDHYNQLILPVNFDQVEVIHSGWYGKTRFDVQPSTIRNGVKTGLETWVMWEKETKKLYENMYTELMQIGEVAGALFLKDIICDVDKELKTAETYWLNKRMADYSMDSIMADQ